MSTTHYLQQKEQWPKSGRHILAKFNEHSIFVYQAYRPTIANFASENQIFGGEFSFNRMSWIKPNFLWMMYRSGWATKEGQKRTLSIEVSRDFFEEILKEAVSSSFSANEYTTNAEWKHRLASSEVRLQWDPDHGPNGEPLERKAIQLGLRGRTLKRFGTTEVLSINDITNFVTEQRQVLAEDPSKLKTPTEEIYFPQSTKAIENIKLDSTS